MGTGHKGGQAVPQPKAHQKIQDLAYDTFVGGDNEAAEATPDDEHAERHQYYRDLRGKQLKGLPLEDHEAAWMQQANQAHQQFQREQKGAVKQQVPFNTFDAAVSEFGKPSMRLGVKRINGTDTGLGTGDFDPTSDDLMRADGTRTTKGMAFQNLEALQRPGIPRAFNDGYQHALTKPTISVDRGGYEPDDFSPTPPVTNKRGQLVMMAKPGEPFAVDEKGNALGIKGTNYGPQQDEGYRFLDRKRSDVYADDDDAFATSIRGGKSELEDQYGEHLDQVEKNGGKYPSGYFKGMKPERKQEIKDGVYKLMLERKKVTNT